MKLKSLLNLTLLASDPQVGSEGDVYFNTTTKQIKIHNGSVFVAITNSTDPVPFYMHTHDYDGEVNTVFPIPLSVEDLGGEGFLIANNGDVDDLPTPIPDPNNTLDGGTI